MGSSLSFLRRLREEKAGGVVRSSEGDKGVAGDDREEEIPFVGELPLRRGLSSWVTKGDGSKGDSDKEGGKEGEEMEEDGAEEDGVEGKDSSNSSCFLNRHNVLFSSRKICSFVYKWRYLGDDSIALTI